MPADLTGWLPQTGAIGLLMLAVWAVLSGKIIPRSVHEEVRADRDAYRRTAETALKASAENSAHVERLTTAVGQLTSAVQQQAGTQQEALALLRQLVPPDRSAA